MLSYLSLSIKSTCLGGIVVTNRTQTNNITTTSKAPKLANLIHWWVIISPPQPVVLTPPCPSISIVIHQSLAMRIQDWIQMQKAGIKLANPTRNTCGLTTTLSSCYSWDIMFLGLKHTENKKPQKHARGKTISESRRRPKGTSMSHMQN